MDILLRGKGLSQKLFLRRLHESYYGIDELSVLRALHGSFFNVIHVAARVKVDFYVR